MLSDHPCECGCGVNTNFARQSDTKRGWVKGLPLRFRCGHRAHTIRFNKTWSVDENTGCWNWTRSKTSGHYASMWDGEKNTTAHIVMYERKYGPVPVGKELDHTCRNRHCVNPDHLEPVTHAINMQRGIRAKLRAAEVLSIINELSAIQKFQATVPRSKGRKRKRLLQPEHYFSVAKRYNVSVPAIKHIWHRQTWANLRP